MSIQPPGDQLRADLEKIGETMTDEWLEADRRGRQGDRRRLQVDVIARAGAAAPARSAPEEPHVKSSARSVERCGRGSIASTTCAAAIAALFLILLLLVIVAQMAARWTGQQFPGSTDYAGYCMAAASFLALAHTLNRGAHIRVALLLSQARALAPDRRALVLRHRRRARLLLRVLCHQGGAGVATS